ncbi:MAG: hypothetical protein U1A78_38960 [Polyangia bacterium]
MPSTYSLVAAAPTAALSASYPLGATGPLLSCQGIAALRLSLDEPFAVTSLRLRFVGVAALDTWQSWHRAAVLPRPGALRLLGPSGELAFEEHRFALDRSAPDAATQPIRDGMLVELRLAPGAPGRLELQLQPGAYVLAGIEAADAPYRGEPWRDPGGPELGDSPKAQPELPRSGDKLAEQLRALAAQAGTPEPTLEQVARLAPPYRGGALLGLSEGPVAYQLWDGGLIVRAAPSGQGSGDRAWYRLLLGARLDDVVRSEQRLRRGYLPIAELEQESASADGCTLKQTAFVDADGALRARWQVRGPDAAAQLCERAAGARLLKTTNEPVLRVQELVPLPLDPQSEQVVIGGHAGTRTLQPTADGAQAELWLPLGEPPRAPPRPTASPVPFDQALRAVEDEAEAYLAQGAQLALPDARLDRLWRGLLLHNRLFVRGGAVRYGLFPGVYDGGLFGVEEGWNIVALAMYGHADEAARTLAATFFDAEFLKKEGQHHQYRNGLALTYLRDVVMLTGDDMLLRRLWPTVIESADWIAAAFASTRKEERPGARPPHYGLMPKHTYGGDLKDPAYSLYGSSACWRGLRDAARLGERLGDGRAAAWRAAAAQARVDLHASAERIFRAAATPPFLPFRTDETTAEPSARDYHQLFASLVLETALFGWHGRFAQHLTDYLFQTGRQVLGVARFDQWFGRLGVDAEYSRGTQLCALHRRDFDRFWLGLLGQVGLSCDPHTLVSPETAIVYFTAEEHRARLRTLAEQPCRFDSDPCSAGTAVMLQYLRYLLCTEERDEDDEPTGVLWLLPAAPPSWFLPGQRIVAERLPTLFGAITLRSEATERTIEITITTTTTTDQSPAQDPLDVELFYCVAGGGRRSTKLRVERELAVTLVRVE